MTIKVNIIKNIIFLILINIIKNYYNQLRADDSISSSFNFPSSFDFLVLVTKPLLIGENSNLETLVTIVSADDSYFSYSRFSPSSFYFLSDETN